MFEVPGASALTLESDRVLVNRVLGNLIKNALEASDPGQQVTVSGALIDETQVRFTVHNVTVMPREVQLQVFQRSFSTRGGAGRGLGTFSVKILTSRYLGGRVEFSSDQHRGTMFSVTLPRCRTRGWRPDPGFQGAGENAAVLDGRQVLLPRTARTTSGSSPITSRKPGPRLRWPRTEELPWRQCSPHGSRGPERQAST